MKDQAKAHWKEFRPKMFKDLKQDGTLDEAATRAASQTYQEQQLIMKQLEDQQGGPKQGYMERVRRLTMNRMIAEELTQQRHHPPAEREGQAEALEKQITGILFCGEMVKKNRGERKIGGIEMKIRVISVAVFVFMVFSLLVAPLPKAFADSGSNLLLDATWQQLRGVSDQEAQTLNLIYGTPEQYNQTMENMVGVSPFHIQPGTGVVSPIQYDDSIQTVSKTGGYDWQYDLTDWTWQLEVPSQLLAWDRSVNSTTQQYYSSNGLMQNQILNSASSNIGNLILSVSTSENGDYAPWVNETINSQWIGSLANALDASAKSAGYDSYHEADFILSFVGSAIPYVTTVYPELPAQTLIDSGDCKAKSILYASILQSLGYKVALLYYTNGYMAAGVALDDSQLPQGSSLTYYLNNGTKYYFAETAEPGWTIGNNNGDTAIQNISANVYVVN